MHLGATIVNLLNAIFASPEQTATMENGTFDNEEGHDKNV